MHTNESPLAGKTVKIKTTASEIGGEDFRVEDWWDRVAGKSWMVCDGNPACIHYALRTGCSDVDVPTDNEVLYGKVGMFRKLVHLSEIEVTEPAACG